MLKKWIGTIIKGHHFAQPSNIIHFPIKETPLMSSAKEYVAETLKMKGFKIKVDAHTGPHQIDILLPNERMLILCVDGVTGDNLEKVYRKKLHHYACSNGWQLAIVRKSAFYLDLRTTLLKARQRRFETKV